MSWQGLIKEYREFLPVTENTPGSITPTLLPMDEQVILEHIQGVKQL